MPRTIGWENETITGGRSGGADKESRFRGQKGVTFVIRVVTECEEYRQHFVDDVLEPDKNGDARGFNMTCGKSWDDDADDYVGDCEGCEREYDLNTKYIAGILVLGTYKGRNKRLQRIDPENSVHWWDFGPDKYRQISDIVLDLQRAAKKKKLSQVELTVKCEDEGYQKLTIQVSQADPVMDKSCARDYIDCWKESGPDLIAAATKTPDLTEQKRNLKKRKPRKKADDDGDDEQDDKPKRSAKRSSKRQSEPEPDDDDGDVGEEDLDALLGEL